MTQMTDEQKALDVKQRTGAGGVDPGNRREIRRGPGDSGTLQVLARPGS